jgi:hypothetical protein
MSTVYGGYHGGQQQRKNHSLNRAITGAVTHGGLIQITTSVPHGFNTGDFITVTAVGGTVEANAANWRITVTAPTTFDLVGSTFTNAYTSGGNARRTQGT